MLQVLHSATNNVQLALTKDYTWEFTIDNKYLTPDGNVEVTYDNYVGGKTLAIGTSQTTNDSITFNYSKKDLLNLVARIALTPMKSS